MAVDIFLYRTMIKCLSRGFSQYIYLSAVYLFFNAVVGKQFEWFVREQPLPLLLHIFLSALHTKKFALKMEKQFSAAADIAEAPLLIICRNFKCETHGCVKQLRQFNRSFSVYASLLPFAFAAVAINNLHLAQWRQIIILSGFCVRLTHTHTSPCHYLRWISWKFHIYGSKCTHGELKITNFWVRAKSPIFCH